MNEFVDKKLRFLKEYNLKKSFEVKIDNKTMKYFLTKKL